MEIILTYTGRSWKKARGKLKENWKKLESSLKERWKNFVRKLHGNIYLTHVKKAWKITIIVPSTRNSALWKSKVKVGFPVEVPIHRNIIKSYVNPLAIRGCKLSRFNLQPLFMWFTNYNIKSEIIRVVSIHQYFTAKMFQ